MPVLVRPGMLVDEAQGVPDLVHDYAQVVAAGVRDRDGLNQAEQVLQQS